MNQTRRILKQKLLESTYQLAILELELEAAKDDFKECSSVHSEIMISFVIEQKLLDIKKKKYDIKHTESLLTNGN